MLFNSFHFLIFFVVVFFVYYALPHKFRWVLLLASSWYFYMCWKPIYILLLLATTVLSYVSALLIERYESHGKLIVISFSAICFAVLFYFKYLNFFCSSLNRLFTGLPFLPDLNIPFFNIVLPIGISFHTFQNVGYQLDVYRKEVSAERHFGYYALFGSYFPQLVAGPIERTANLLPQLKEEHHFTYENGSQGMRLVLIGLFKKVAIADSIAIYVDNVYNHVETFTGLPLIIATVLFAFQIYCDFSGYSDIALGVSRMLGINLMYNFRGPYLSKSVSEFWRRWHISLSTWFRDNVYIPLGGNRVKLPRHLINLLITFSLSGMWHGASWNFFIWGALLGLFLCIEVLIRKAFRNRKNIPDAAKKEPPLKRILKIVFVFILVDFAWIFFRANGFHDAIYIIRNLFTGIEFSLNYVRTSLVAMGFKTTTFVLTGILLLCLVLLDNLNYEHTMENRVGTWKAPVRYAFYLLLAVLVVVCIMFTAQSQNFIYFQF